MNEPIPPSRVSLRDIAKKLGVSHSTVSLALRNHPRISESVRQKVHSEALSMGYQPDPMLTALAHYRQSRVEVPVRAAMGWLNLWPDPAHIRKFKEFDAYWKGATAAAHKFGYHLEEFACNDLMTLPRLEKVLTARNVTGILIPPQPWPIDWGNFRWERYSAARFGRSVKHPAFHLVTSDHVSNTVIAFQAMQERGYHRIGFVTGQGKDRGGLFRAGFFMCQCDLDESQQLPPLVLRENEPSDSTANQLELSIWLRKNKPDAILTDVAKLRQMLDDIGYRVPEDVSLAALSVLDGNADAGINQNPEEIGRVGFLVVYSLINDNARGIPPIPRQVLVCGDWVDGSTLPRR